MSLWQKYLRHECFDLIQKSIARIRSVGWREFAKAAVITDRLRRCHELGVFLALHNFIPS